jgi:uncharacterized protein YndB with AHSA1/START domain
MTAIQHEIWIDAPVSVVYDLIATPEGMSSWWDQQRQVQTDEGEVWEHTPGPEHGTVRMLLLDRTPHRRFSWRCISAHAPDVPASAWTGTVMTFALGDRRTSSVASEPWAQRAAIQTVLAFSHEGWDPNSRYLAFCNTAWAGVLQQLADKATEAYEPHD